MWRRAVHQALALPGFSREMTHIQKCSAPFVTRVAALHTSNSIGCSKSTPATAAASTPANTITSIGSTSADNERGLAEFFPDMTLPPNQRNTSGRAWKVSDLRLKSDTDLHKLWYVLLKERNMLATLKWAARRLRVEMPGQDRFWKVEDSMDNLRKVLLERDEAFRLADEEIRRMGQESTALAEPLIETIDASDAADAEQEEEAAEANKHVRRGVTVTPDEGEDAEMGEEPWLKQWDVRSFNEEELAEYKAVKNVERKIYLMRREYRPGSLRALKNKRRARGKFLARRYPQMLNAKSPWIRPSSKLLRGRRKQSMKRFFVSGKMFTVQ